MSDRQFALKSKISELTALLETIRNNGVESVEVRTERNEARTYSVGGLHDALSSLAAEVISSQESTIAQLEEKYEHDRADVFRIVGRLAEVASPSIVDNSRSTTTRLSTF